MKMYRIYGGSKGNTTVGFCFSKSLAYRIMRDFFPTATTIGDVEEIDTFDSPADKENKELKAKLDLATACIKSTREMLIGIGASSKEIDKLIKQLGRELG